MACLIFLLIVVACIQVFGSRAGRIGGIFVDGDSAQEVAPYGSLLSVWPASRAVDGQMVVAWARDPNATDSQDKGWDRVVKRYQNGWLVSPSGPDRYPPGSFVITGRVLKIVHTEKLLWWINKGMQNSAPGYKEPTELDRQVVDAGYAIASARDKWLSENCQEYNLNQAKITGGHHRDDGLVAEQSEMIATFNFNRLSVIVEVEVQPPGEFWSFTSNPSIGEQILGSNGRFRPSPSPATTQLTLNFTGCLNGANSDPATVNSIRVWTQPRPDN